MFHVSVTLSHVILAMNLSRYGLSWGLGFTVICMILWNGRKNQRGRNSKVNAKETEVIVCMREDRVGIQK